MQRTTFIFAAIAAFGAACHGPRAEGTGGGGGIVTTSTDTVAAASIESSAASTGGAGPTCLPASTPCTIGSECCSMFCSKHFGCD